MEFSGAVGVVRTAAKGGTTPGGNEVDPFVNLTRPRVATAERVMGRRSPEHAVRWPRSSNSLMERSQK